MPEQSRTGGPRPGPPAVPRRCELQGVVLALGLLLTAPAQAAAPPVVFVSPDGSNVAVPVLVTGSNDLVLWFETGDIQTPGYQVVCEDGNGDELCAIQLEIVTTGSAVITGFSQAAGVQWTWDPLDPTWLRLNRINALGAADRGTIPLGTLHIDKPGSGDVQLTSASSAVGADLGLLAVGGGNPLAMPEPGGGALLAAGLACLALLGRRRLRGVSVGLLPVAVLALSAAPADAQVFFDQGGFQNAAGTSAVVFDMNSALVPPLIDPCDGSICKAFSNGHDFGPFSWESITFASDIPLELASGNPSGATGTLLVDPNGGSPGGWGGASDPADEDDYRLIFDPPVQAAGVLIIHNRNGLEPAETIQFLDANDNVLFSTPLPGAANSGQDGYVGLVQAASAPKIVEIRVDEGQVHDDDTSFNFIIYAEDVSIVSTPQEPRPRLRFWDQISTATGIPSIAGPGIESFGFDVAALGDLDGNLITEVAVGMPGYGSPLVQGGVEIVSLASDGSVVSTTRISDTEGGLTPGNAGGELAFLAGFGAALEAFDVDGDGSPELAVGSDTFGGGGNNGRIYILHLNPDGTVALPFQRIGQGEGGFDQTLEPGDRFGASVAALGDLDDDGVVDLAAGAPWDDEGGAGPQRGVVYLLFMNSDGTVRETVKLDSTSPGLAGRIVDGDQFGADVEGIGDLDLDGVPDLAVGVPGNGSGAAWILFLNTDGSIKNVVEIDENSGVGFTGAIGVEGIGHFIDDGDLLGWGLGWIPTAQGPTRGILAVGAVSMQAFNPGTQSYWDPGAVFLLTLNADGTVAGETGVIRTESLFGLPVPGLFSPPSPESDFLGRGITSIGDLNQDGFDDLLVGAVGAWIGGVEEGAAYILSLGGLSGTAFADAVSDETSGVTGATNALGPPDNMGARLFTGETLTVQFVDNAARGSGDVVADLMIHLLLPFINPDPIDVIVEASENGVDYVTVLDRTVAAFDTAIPVDLDQGGLGFGTDALVRFVRITQADTMCSGPPVFCMEQSFNAVEALSNESFTEDVDFDTVPDAFDNCRTTYNPDQLDLDGDEVGDLCDNCREDANLSQDDADTDGEGDVCEETIAKLTFVGDPLNPQWTLSVRCPGTARGSLNGINIGEHFPSGIDGASVAFFPSAFVDVPMSQVVLPGLAPPGADPDTMYLHVPFDQPCQALSEQELGTIISGPEQTLQRPVTISTRQGISFLQFPLFNAIPRYDVLVCIGTNCGAELIVSIHPSGMESPLTAIRWDLCYAAEELIHRVAIGVRFFGITSGPNDIWLEGCEGPPDAFGRVACDGPEIIAGMRVDPNTSFTMGPYAASDPDLPAGLAADTLYVVLEGRIPAQASDTLGLATGDDELNCVGVVEFTNAPGEFPDLDPNAVDSLPYYDSIQEGWLTANQVLSPVLLADVATLQLVNALEDYDEDGTPDADDNCDFEPNPNQANDGKLLGYAPDVDESGNLCQCGDVEFSGAIFAIPTDDDFQVLRDYVLGIPSPDDLEILRLGSVYGSHEVDLQDLVVHQRAVNGLPGPGIAPACEAALPCGPNFAAPCPVTP